MEEKIRFALLSFISAPVLCSEGPQPHFSIEAVA